MDARARAIAEEQDHVDRAYDRLEQLRQLAERRRREALAAPTVTHADLVDRDAAAHEAATRVRSLTLGDEEPLVFGRLDLDDETHHHVGRVSVLSEDYDPLVVDWRSDAAAAFYRATPRDPMGVRRRRVIACHGRHVIGVEDQLLGDVERASDEDVVGDAALMAAVTRDRSARMRDIVATIQREQDAVIRLPARGFVVVAGGPGTGKTAVALHRVAYLLYRHRQRLERRGVLIVGPTRAFTDYIDRVLPSLGETTAVLRPLGAFVPGIVTDRHDPRDVAALKGDLRARHLLHSHVARLPGRTTWRDAFDQLRSGPLPDDVLAPRERDLLERTWRADHEAGRPPTVEDVALADELRDLLPSPVARPAGGDEREPELSTFADRSAAVDPADLIGAPDYREFGHVVVDEAQDLSAMQWRMVARRGREASWTVVGDLAQRSTPAAPATWDEVATEVGARHVRITHLSVNYRTAAPIADFAARLLPAIAPHQRPPRSARSSSRAPTVRVGVADPFAATVAEARRARAALTGTVGVVVGGPTLPRVAAALSDTDVRVFDPWTVKGLEFDGVVVAEPAAIADEVGLGGLYVALTRATDHLVVVSGDAGLPGPLDEEASTRPRGGT